MPTAKERFEQKFVVTPGCWKWTAGFMSAGYGAFYPRHGFQVLAHRYSYELYKGPIPSDLLIRHRCDNKWCVNPEHLIPGTVADNTQDSIERGTYNCGRGERAGHAKLTAVEVRQIRDLAKVKFFSRRQIALRYDISPSVVYGILTGKYWSSV